MPVHGQSYVSETPILSITFVGRLSVGFFANRVGADLKMRWFVHVFARLAIAATWTSSAAALDAQVERGKYLSSANSLWEHLMLNSSESANRVVRRYNVPSRELRFDLRDNSGAAHENLAHAPRLDLAAVNSRPAAMPAITRADRQNTGPWSSIFTFFMEGFALYGAWYGALLNAIATSPVESAPIDAEAEKLSVRERRRAIAIVSSTSSEVTGSELENDTSRTGPGTEAPSEDIGLAEFYDSHSFDTDRSSQRNWLTKPWSASASRWARWHREREIKRTVAALAELDDRTLRDIGIPHRSQIEQVVRYCRDC